MIRGVVAGLGRIALSAVCDQKADLEPGNAEIVIFSVTLIVTQEQAPCGYEHRGQRCVTCYWGLLEKCLFAWTGSLHDRQGAGYFLSRENRHLDEAKGSAGLIIEFSGSAMPLAVGMWLV